MLISLAERVVAKYGDDAAVRDTAAAALLHAVGWQMLNLLLLPWLAAAAAALLWLGWRQRNQAAGVAAG